MKPGYIKLHRSFYSHWLWGEGRSFSKAEAFLDLLQLAAFAPTKRMISGSLIELEQGELVASVRYLGARWTWGKDKVADFLKMLESDGMIRRRSRHGETIVNLCNYKDYNGDADTPSDSKPDRQPTDARQTPDKVEEDKEERERKPAGGIRRPTLEQAKAAASNMGIPPMKADEWWHAREASEWMKGMAGGGTSPVGSNWQADLKTYATRGSMNPGHNGHATGRPKKELTGADISL